MVNAQEAAEFFTALIGQHRDVVFCAVQIIDYRETRDWEYMPTGDMTTGLFYGIESTRARIDVHLKFLDGILQEFKVLK